MSSSRYTLLIDSSIDLKKFRDNFRVYLERAHPVFLTTLVVLVWNWIDSKILMFLLGSYINRNLLLYSLIAWCKQYLSVQYYATDFFDGLEFGWG